MAVVLLLSLVGLAMTVSAEARRPNFVLLMVDDLGYGDLSSYGNATLHSVNVDRLMSEGVKMTHALAQSATCTPSRASFLTGRYPGRSGMDPGSFMPVIPSVAQPWGLPQSEITFATMLRNVGYSTAMIGKWHQGLNCYFVGDKCHHPHTHGFDFFYGLPHSNTAENKKGQYSPAATVIISYVWYVASFIGVSLATSFWVFRRNHRIVGCAVFIVGVLPVYLMLPLFYGRFLNGVLMRDDVVVEQPLYLESMTRRFVRETAKFINEKDDPQKPFLVLLAFTHVHGHLVVGSNFSGLSNHGVFGDSVLEMDWAVGQILDVLDKRGIRNDTFVLFASDHGAHVEEAEDKKHAGSNSPFSGGKGMYGMEGGIRVPMIMSWPGKILPGVISAPVTLMDVFPTLANLAGTSIPSDRILDGRDLCSLLFGPRPGASPHRVLFHHCEAKNVHAVTVVQNESTVWKVHFFQPRWLPGKRRCKGMCRCRDKDLTKLDKPLIYNIRDDPSETRPIPTSPEYKEVLEEAQREISLHLSTMEDVPKQVNLNGFIWRPWLQPWCSIPFKSCRESDQENDP